MSEIIGEGRTAQILAWGEGRVLKLYYDWQDPRWVQREFEATQKAYRAGVPVPHPYDLIEHEGRPGIVFERIQGLSGLALFRKQPWRLPELIRQIAQLQAQTLAVRAPDLPDLREHFEATIQHVIQLGLDPTRGEQILARLAQLPDGDCLCHMDFHPDNVMYTAKGWVIIDWMNARSGAALADVARSTLMYQVGGPPPGTPGGFIISLGGRLAYSFYSKAIRSYMKFTQEELDAWMLPVATARLVEDIPGEREKLIQIIDRLLKS